MLWTHQDKYRLSLGSYVLVLEDLERRKVLKLQLVIYRLPFVIKEHMYITRARNWWFPVDRIYQKPCRTTRSLFIDGPLVHSKYQERETENSLKIYVFKWAIVWNL